jgi:tRNA threonylcarbamoyladenosine biosynthesis protein TsaE
MGWEPIFRDLQRRAGLDLPSKWKICRLPQARRSITQFQKAKITNCYLRFRGVNAIAYCGAGTNSFQDCCSLVLAPSLDAQPETINFSLVATLISNSPAETEAVGRRLAEDAEVGSILALQGELGSGKTLFTKGFVAGIGSNTAVFSPTFTILHEYRNGRLPVYHFDFFRVESRQALERLGLDDYFFGDGVSVIEWADRFPEFIPEQARWIRFEIKSENQRAVTFQGT